MIEANVDHRIRELMSEVKADPENGDAFNHLHNSLLLIRERHRRRLWPKQKDLNQNLDTIIELSEKLRNALSMDANTLHVATSALLEEIAEQSGKPMSVERVRNSLLDLAEVAEAAKKPTVSGRRSAADDPEKDEAVKLLMGFVGRYGKVALSKKEQSSFAVFATEAYELATGETANLIRAIRRIRETGYPAVIEARKGTKTAET